MQLSIFTGTGEAEEVRSHFRRFMSRGHKGWDDTFDRQFDDRAVWLHLTGDRGKHLAAARLIFRKVGDRDGPLPSDLGDLAAFMPPDDGSTALSAGATTVSSAVLPGGGVAPPADPSPLIVPGAICEASGMSFKSRRHLALLLPIYMRWMQQRRLGAVYSLYDASNTFVHWLQCELLMFRHVRNATVAFDGFRYKDGEPVTWQATVLDPLLRIQSLSNAQRNRREAWGGQAPKVEVMDRVPQSTALPSVPTPSAAQEPSEGSSAAISAS